MFSAAAFSFRPLLLRPTQRRKAFCPCGAPKCRAKIYLQQSDGGYMKLYLRKV